MERKNVSQVQIYVRDALNRANRQASTRDYAGAVATLLPVVKKNPDVPLLFEKIREYEIAKCRKLNPAIKTLGILASLFVYPVVKIVSFVDPLVAMSMCEGLLALSVDNPLMLSVMADASDNAGAPWGAATALGVIREFHPNNEGNLRRLAAVMQQNQQAGEALKIHQMLAKKSKSLSAKADLREAMALASLERGKFNDKSQTGANAADAKDAIIQQLLDGTIHDAEQAQVLIERFTADLKVNDSIDMRRKLADAYMVAENFEEALKEYRAVADKLGVIDPVLDKHIERAYLSQLKASIAELKRNPDAYENAENQIRDLEKEYEDYRWRHTVDRANKFPNDMQLQFDLGELQFEHGDIETAKVTFERVAENPQKRRASLVFLGRCALLTNKPQDAKSYLEEAIKDMGRMDKYKREAMYHLGEAFEALGNIEEALVQYRAIHANMSNYRDVPERLAKLDIPALEVSADDQKSN